MGKRSDQVRGMPVVVVIAEHPGQNPHNPYDRLTPEERHAEIVALLARVYQRLPESKVADPEKREAA